MLAILAQRKLILIILLVLIIIVGIVLAVVSSRNNANKKITLTYWGLWQPKEVMQPIIDKFQRDNPNITITYEQKSLTGYRNSIIKRIEAGTGPDIFKIHNTWVRQMPNISRMLLSEVPPAIYPYEQIERDFYPTVKESLTLSRLDPVSGKETGKIYYAIPLQFDTLAILYNEDLVNTKQTELATANLSFPPKTWSTFQTTARLLTQYDENERVEIAGAALGTANNVDNFSDIVGLLMAQSHVTFQTGKKLGIHTTMNSSQTVNLGADVLAFYTDFAKGKTRVWDATLKNSTQLFAEGKVAMILVPSWRLTEILEMQQASGIKFNIKAASVPKLDSQASRENVYWATYWAESVSAKSKNQQAAWKFVKYLSENETMKNLYAEEVKQRKIGELYSRRDLKDFLKDDPIASVYLEGGPTATSWYLASRTKDQGVNDKNIEYLKTAIESMEKTGIDAQSAIKTFALNASKEMAKYNIVDALQQ